MAKDAAAAAQQRAPKEAASDPAPAEEQTAAAATAAAPPPAASSSAAARRQRQAAPAAPLVAPSTVVNLAVHSLLMITVPFALFFTSLLGGLDPLFTLTGARVPGREAKAYIGAVLAVLGVNAVIASFVVAAFREDSKPDVKQD